MLLEQDHLAEQFESGSAVELAPARSPPPATTRSPGICGRPGSGALADLGFVGLDDKPDDDPVIITGRKATRNHRLTVAEKEANRLASREGAANEHGFANLKTWQILTKLRMNARHATTLLRALLVLATYEVQR
ncbi:hypothetical protein [Streptomyces sp. NPDC054765]